MLMPTVQPPLPTLTPSAPVGCTACPGDCLDACFNDAIASVAGAVRIDAANCAGCGACLPACNLGHIRLEHGVALLVPSAPSGDKHDD